MDEWFKPMTSTDLTVFLLCPGLGRIRRGYESFTQECFEALRISPELDLRLFKGGGMDGKNETVLRNLSRGSVIARCAGQLLRRDAYFIEQATFFLSLRRHLTARNPDVVYFSDGNLGNLLWHWRRRHRRGYRLLLSNGGPLSPPFPRWDLVQQLASPYFDAAQLAGQPADRQVLLPYGFAIPEKLAAADPAARAVQREPLGLPVERAIVLSAGAVNRSHKRMDYLIREVAALPAPRPFLLILGQTDHETVAVTALAEQLLGAENFQIRSVRPEQMPDYYRASDIFTLASLSEGFGRVFIEASASGLPCLAHDYPVAREVLGGDGIFGDFRQPGALARLFGPALVAAGNETVRQARHRAVYRRFSWDVLRGRYVDMIRHCAASNLNLSTD